MTSFTLAVPAKRWNLAAEGVSARSMHRSQRPSGRARRLAPRSLDRTSSWALPSGRTLKYPGTVFGGWKELPAFSLNCAHLSPLHPPLGPCLRFGFALPRTFSGGLPAGPAAERWEPGRAVRLTAESLGEREE